MKKQIIAVSAVGLALVGLVGASSVFAKGFGPGNGAMITELAQKLGVSEDKVKEAFASIRSEKQGNMQSKIEERLTQAVKDGKITEAQKTLILNKQKELADGRKQDMDSMKNMTMDERWAAMKKKQDDLKAWAEQNSIDLTYLGGFGRGMRGPGMHRGMK